MLAYFQPARDYAGGVVVNVTPDSIVITTAGGTTVQPGLTSAVDAQGHWYVDTTDALYTDNTKYVLVTTTTTALGVVTEDHPFWHRTFTSGDVTPPGAAAGAWVSSTDTTITILQTPPADADYDHTLATAVVAPGDGSAPLTATGSGTSISITGATPGRGYFLTLQSVDTSGNVGPIGAGSVFMAETMPTEVPALPAFIKCFVNQESTARRIFAIDPTLKDANDARATNHELRPNIRGRIHRVRFECHSPLRISLRSMAAILQTRDGEVGGLKGGAGN